MLLSRRNSWRCWGRDLYDMDGWVRCRRSGRGGGLGLMCPKFSLQSHYRPFYVNKGNGATSNEAP